MIRRMTCPICEKELPPEMTGNSAEFPFCSKRCKQVDLQRWLNGEYACIEPLSPDQIPGEPKSGGEEYEHPTQS